MNQLDMEEALNMRRTGVMKRVISACQNSREVGGNNNAKRGIPWKDGVRNYMDMLTEKLLIGKNLLHREFYLRACGPVKSKKCSALRTTWMLCPRTIRGCEVVQQKYIAQ